MLSLLKQVYNLFDYDYQKEQYAKKFEEETEHFEKELKKEQSVEEPIDKQAPSKKDEEITCSKRTGVITSLRSSNGSIDNSLFFEAKEAAEFGDFKVGSKVEFLTYKSEFSDYLRIVKVELLQDNSWDESPTEKQIQETINSLKCEEPKYFNTHHRSILGLITSRNRQFLTVDTDYKEITVDLDVVSIEFIPKEGDRVYLNCNVQTDEEFVDLAGEILETISVHPARTKRENGVVKEMHEDWGVIDSDCYFTMDTIEAKLQLDVGDVVSADMIECERGKFFWRCITIKLLERSAVPQKENPTQKPGVVKSGGKVIEIPEEIRFIFQNAFEKQQQEIEIRNNSERVHTIQRIDLVGIRRNSQLSLEDNVAPVNLQPGQTVKIILHCESRFYGHAKEKILFTFGNFKIYRFINIAVGVDENKENIEDKSNLKTVRSRGYAQKVWSQKNVVVPGVRTIVSRRFVAKRIDLFDVPEKLRTILLADTTRAEQIANLYKMYPSLGNDVHVYNYVNRFQTLLFIEEIEHFVNFRQYDRERAHFTREGEFLALTIDNLAERRPSLVIGDSVHATNPWCGEDDVQTYAGHIHKVLFNKILVKFNPAFQDKYNGEDYRLEFYYSRFSFRKQHHAIKEIFQKGGEKFLFPSKIILNETLQLDADLDGDCNLRIGGKLLPMQWCNSKLNEIQKNAIKNILRREARTMPYVIFGPPGTGKTVTLVETVLQLVKNLPHCRVLIGTPSNSAADLITTRLIDSKVLNPGDFVRLVSQKLIEQDLIPENLKPYCATIDLAVDGSIKDSMIVTESGMKLKCQMKHLGRHKITISTCATIGNFHQMDFPKEHFTHLIVDESGQCSEPEFMIAASLLNPKSGQIVLVGDPYQLGPITVNNFAGERGLKTSFLERLVQRFPYRRDKVRFPETGSDPRLVTKLIYNYRALPSILHAYSSLFYDSELRPMLAAEGNKEFAILDSVRSLLPKSETRSASHALFFQGIRGENKQDSDSPSWYNPIEAKHIFLMTIQLYRLSISSNQIGIITPYQKQVRVLRNLFAESDVAMPKIGSVEEFQGQERDIILISTVRSSKDFLRMDLKYALGFASSPKRMNVAISRARSLLYVCGNPHLLSLTDTWRDLIQYCVDNDAYVGCDLPDKLTKKEADNSDNSK